jgi:hypothetical protein
MSPRLVPDHEDDGPLKQTPPLKPAPTTELRDTDPVPPPEDEALKAIRAVHALVANLALQVDSIEHKVDHAVDVGRAAQSAAIMASDSAKLLRKESLAALAALDAKVEHIAMRQTGVINTLAEMVADQRHVLHDHQQRLDRAEGHNGNGNGHGYDGDTVVTSAEE